MFYDHPIFGFFASIYQRLIQIGNNLQSIFLLYMRLTWGFQFFLVGLHKFQQMDQTIQFFRNLQISHPVFNAYLVAGFEMGGGLLLIAGLASRVIAIPLILIMLTALNVAHAADLWTFRWLLEPTDLAIQAPYPYLITAILLFVFGPGRLSIDAWLKRQISEKK